MNQPALQRVLAGALSGTPAALWHLTPCCPPPVPACTDIQAPGLVELHSEGTPGTATRVQLHLGRPALLGGAPGGGSAAAASSGAAPPPQCAPAPAPAPQPRPGSAGPQGYKPNTTLPNQYTTSTVPSRHLVLLGVTAREDVARLAGIARQHGTLEHYFCNARSGSMTLHFSAAEAAKNMAREVEGQAVPGLQSAWGCRGCWGCGRAGCPPKLPVPLLRSQQLAAVPAPPPPAPHPAHLPARLPASRLLPSRRPRPAASHVQAPGCSGSRRGRGRGKGSRAAAQGRGKGSQAQRAAAAVAVLCHGAQLCSASEEAQRCGIQVSAWLGGSAVALPTGRLPPPPLPCRCRCWPCLAATVSHGRSCLHGGRSRVFRRAGCRASGSAASPALASPPPFARRRQGLAQVGQAAGSEGFKDCTFFPTSGIGYLFFHTKEAASTAAAALRGGELPWSQGARLHGPVWAAGMMRGLGMHARAARLGQNTLHELCRCEARMHGGLPYPICACVLICHCLLTGCCAAHLFSCRSGEADSRVSARCGHAP